MKICVYAIAKNEEKFVNRWYESVKEADKIFVLDTGSTDNTVNLLKKHNIIVKEKIINPWRFDIARNESLAMVDLDTDICICIDLDEILLPGWRNELEKIWNSNINRCRYIYNWKLDEKNKPIISFYYEKIHSRNNYSWIYPVHEILKYSGDKPENYITTDNIILNHYPDINKNRSNYLELLKLSVKENPSNDRNMHYLGREYMYYNKWNKAIDTLEKHLNLKTAIWKDERCASMRFISRCYQNLNRYEEAKMWLTKSIEEAPYLRDPYIEMALLQYRMKNWLEVEKYCNKALQIKINNKTYINEQFTFDETVYDLLSLSYFYQNKYNESINAMKNALQINPSNKRIKDNLNKIIEYIK